MERPEGLAPYQTAPPPDNKHGTNYRIKPPGKKIMETTIYYQPTLLEQPAAQAAEAATNTDQHRPTRTSTDQPPTRSQPPPADAWQMIDIIDRYTRAEALADGVLYDLSAQAPDVCRQLFKYPIACTAAVYDLITRAINHPEWHNDIKGVIWDILYMSQHAPDKRMIDASTALFTVIITGTGRKRYHRLKLQVHPGDQAEPVITILLPEED